MPNNTDRQIIDRAIATESANRAVEAAGHKATMAMRTNQIRDDTYRTGQVNPVSSSPRRAAVSRMARSWRGTVIATGRHASRSPRSGISDSRDAINVRKAVR